MPRCLLLCAVLSAGLGAQTTSPLKYRQLAHDIFRELVEINTSYYTGSTTPAAEAMAARLRAAGFPTADIQVLGAHAKKANLVARYRGLDRQKPLLLLAHLDVVEARREDWTMDPFRLLERDGYFYGRGTGDDKAQAAIWIANLIRAREEGWKPGRDLIVALTADEEGGGPYNGVAWLLEHRKDLIDAELCLNEGGWGEIRDGKRLLQTVQVSEKFSVNFRVEVTNKGGHSSIPVKENAIYRLAGALERLSAFEFPVDLNEVTSNYFGELSKVVSGPASAEMKAVAAGDKVAAERLAALDPSWNALLRTTCIATRLEGGHASNALPQMAAATVNCRVLPGHDAEQVQQALKRAVGDDNVVISTASRPAPSPPSPLREDVLEAARAASAEIWPGVPVIPYMVMGGTDGRMLREAGIPTYGISGIFHDAQDIRFHGRDERLAVDSFYEGQEFLYRLVKRLVS